MLKVEQDGETQESWFVVQDGAEPGYQGGQELLLIYQTEADAAEELLL